ncbi:MAG TPA: hypothetical protein VGO53_08790, partial [Steroidobacteraceae bacterium]|nr:hypothetical protein [Steroidobacteraceae bacterium]
MIRSNDRILTTHVGSIVRPKALLDLANQSIGPPADPVQYAELLRESVADIVQRQAAAGIDIVNDGEYGKSSWANYVLERMSGFEPRPGTKASSDWLGRDRERFPEVIAQEFAGYSGLAAQACTSAIQYGNHADVRRDAANLKAALSNVKVTEGFLTVVAPASAVFNGINEFYGSE